MLMDLSIGGSKLDWTWICGRGSPPYGVYFLYWVSLFLRSPRLTASLLLTAVVYRRMIHSQTSCFGTT